MEQNLVPPDVSGGVRVIVEKLNSGQKIIVKTPTNAISHAYLLANIIKDDCFPKSPVLFVVRDEFEKLNIKTGIKHWAKESKIAILNDLSTATLFEIKEKNQCLIILTEQEALLPLPSKKDFEARTINIKAKDKTGKEDLLKKLVLAGFAIERTADEKGIASNRGSIVDVHPPNCERAFRIDFDDNIIDSIKSPDKKGKTENLDSVAIIPNNLEHLKAQATLNDYNPCLKRLVFDAFPPEQAAAVSFTQQDIRALASLLEPKREKARLPSFIKNLQTGDFVVHIDHGIAKFEGMVQQKIDGITREYFKLCYAQNDALFLPATSAEKMEKYIGDPRPCLNRLSSSGWGKTISKAGIDTLHHSRELLNTQAYRQLSKAPVIPRTKKIEDGLSKSFPYDETKCQKDVIEKIYDDLSKETPMDRLVCGDVGFGKTEIAIRAAAKVGMEGFQVVVLAPTTILTQQHLDTFAERLKNLPINISGLSRFQSKQTQEEVVDKISKGKIDIVIGTHRLLSGDLKFKNLGLIIIDEEQRFGVAHKEQLKKLRSQAHVITLTATPIPRTLHLALSGVRAISIITTPPSGRKPINTIIEPHNQKHVALAIQNEIKRKGQVYYLYNNVETMRLKQEELKELLPKAKFGVLHGQLPEEEMARVMHEFDSKKIDVLVCSTIIENGLDLPNVNTLIVDNAVQFGLSQLHQIRGRIGRGKRQAYAYFFFKRAKLSGEAEKRLEALEEARELGSGFDLAQRDMEIRGVGNVLGKAQHGHIKSIGLGLYLRLLNSAVEEIKSGAPSGMLSDILIDLPVEARIPQFFEPDKQKRIELYHEWALIDSQEELEKTKDEVLKQGALPQSIENLFYIFRLKILGRKAGITSIDTAIAPSSGEQSIILETSEPIEPKRFAKMLDKCKYWVYSTEEIKINKKDLGTDWMKKLELCIKQLQAGY